MNKFDYLIIISIALFVFLSLQNYLGKSMQNIFKFLLAPHNIIYLLLVIIMLIYVVIRFKYNIILCVDEETEKKMVEVSGTNINVHNPNINIPSDVGKYIGHVGAGAAVGAGMTAMANVLKTAPLPPIAKIGGVIAGAVAGGSVFVGTSAASKLVNESLSSSSGSNTDTKDVDSKFNSKSVLENIENSPADYNDVMEFLNANLILHISMLYLLFTLGIMFFSYNYFSYNNKITFINKYLGEKSNKYLKQMFNIFTKYNKIWLLIIWIILLLSTIASVYFSYILVEHIEVISKLVINK